MTLAYVVIGLLSGVLAGIFGIGGGIVIVPALVFFAKMSQKTATGTSLGALLLPAGLLGALEYWRSDQLNVRASLWLAAGLFIGTYGGALLAHALGDSTVRRAFAVLLVGVAARLWMTA